MAYALDPQTLSLGLLIGRLVVGLLMAAHGSQKLFGWFGGHGLDGTGKFFGSLGFQPGRTFATLAGLGELISGRRTCSTSSSGAMVGASGGARDDSRLTKRLLRLELGVLTIDVVTPKIHPCLPCEMS